jgi:transposase InsO family protein
VAQQLREATPEDARPRLLIHDHDAEYGPAFARVAAASGIEVIRTPIRAPRANAVCERFLRSVRRECIDHTLVLGERHLRRVLTEYIAYFNQSRPHQGIGQCTPRAPRTWVSPGRSVEPDGVITVPVLGGLHHDYHAAA